MTTKAYIYKGEGASSLSAQLMHAALCRLLVKNAHDVQYISPEDIMAGKWQRDTGLLVLGGGRGSGFLSALGSEGMAAIKEYVLNGGSYLGCGAGAYLACDVIKFDQGGPLEVSRNGVLNFFHGNGVGPILGNFKYNSNEGCHPAEISMTSDDTTFHAYYDGGCMFYFGDSDPPEGVEIIATYAEVESNPPAVIYCTPERGKVVLMGIHPEHTSSNLPINDPHIQRIMSELKLSARVLDAMFTKSLSYLGLSTVHL